MGEGLKKAMKHADKLNPPRYPIKPIPYGVRTVRVGRKIVRHEVVHLPTKRVVKKFNP